MGIHDALFKHTFAQPEHASGALQAVLPAALSERVDWSTLSLSAGSFVDEALKDCHSDLLWSVRLGERDALIYVLAEHRSEPDERMPFRMLRYMVRIWDAHLAELPKDERARARLPLIVPQVLHHGAGGWTAARDLVDLIDIDPDIAQALGDAIPRFRFLLDDLALVPDDAIRERPMSELGRLVLWCLKHAREAGWLEGGFGRWAELLRHVLQQPDGTAALAALFRYILEASPNVLPEELRALVASEVSMEAQEAVMTAGQRLREEGRNEGRSEGRLEGRTEGRLEGRSEGRLEGQRALVAKLLRLRFGPLSDDVTQRIDSADGGLLERWAERFATAQSLAEVFSD